MVVMVVVMKMRVRPWEKAVIPLMMMVVVMMVMVVVMVIVIILRYLSPALRLCCGDAGIIGLQGIQRIRNRFQQIAIASGWRVLCRLVNASLCGAYCRQRGRCSQKSSDFLVHVLSSSQP